MVERSTVLIIAAVILAAMHTTVYASVEFIPSAERLPPNQPVIALVETPDARVDVSANSLLSVKCDAPVELPPLPETPPWSYTGLPALIVSFNGSLYRAVVIPGLPAASIEFDVVVPGVPRRL